MKKEGKNKKRCGCNKQCLDFGVWRSSLGSSNIILLSIYFLACSFVRLCTYCSKLLRFYTSFLIVSLAIICNDRNRVFRDSFLLQLNMRKKYLETFFLHRISHFSLILLLLCPSSFHTSATQIILTSYSTSKQSKSTTKKSGRRRNSQ
jgi:hypothetical protein